jgi:hypothetical protein
MSARAIHWHEWDFRAVPKNEWAICLRYELSRVVDQAAIRAARAARPELAFDDCFDPALLGENIPDFAFWPEFPAPYQRIKATVRAARAIAWNGEPMKLVREAEVRPDFEAYFTEHYSYVALEISRNASREAFLRACAELWEKHRNRGIPVMSGQGKTTDNERLKWLGAWRILRHTTGDAAKAAQVCKVRGVELYLSEKGWRKAAAAAERLLKGG